MDFVYAVREGAEDAQALDDWTTIRANIGKRQVAISEEPGGRVAQRVGVVDGGLATSSTRVRRWSHHGTVM